MRRFIPTLLAVLGTCALAPAATAEVKTHQAGTDDRHKIEGHGYSYPVTSKHSSATPQTQKITYLKEPSWSQDRLLLGANGMATLTFAEVEIAGAK